jgi:hypothetical protein
MISEQIAISYQFLLSELLDTLDALKKSPTLELPTNATPTIHSSIHQLVPFWETTQIPQCYKRFFLRLHQFLRLEREERDFPKLSHRLESHSQKITMLLRAGEKLSTPFIIITKELMHLLLLSAETFKESENVLFYLLRHAHRIDLHVQPGFTLTILQKTFPEGLKPLTSWMHKKYHARGFDHLHSLIDRHIEALSHA